MKIDDKVDAVYIPDSPSRIKATDYNQIKNEIQECITEAGLTPTKDVIQLPQALKILTAQSGAEEVAKIEAAGKEQLDAVNTAGQTQTSAVKSAGEAQMNNINTAGAQAVHDAQDAANTATSKATEAAGSATEAAGSASAAASSATEASRSASAAASSATEASRSAITATTQATNAADSASSANASASQATTKATEASDSASAAAQSAIDAAQSAQNSRGLAVGTVYYSQSSLATDNPGALPLFTGELIVSANTIYPGFWIWVNNHPELCKTQAEYDSALETYGECPYYVADETEGSLRLPLLKNYVKMANASGGITQKAAGLPNITGTWKPAGLDTNNYEDPTGAFANSKHSSNGYLGHASKTGQTPFAYFDASLSNEIYGSSDTVTPSHTTLYPWVGAFNAAIPASTAQAAQFQQGLSGKADADLSNVEPLSQARVNAIMPADMDYVVERWQAAEPSVTWANIPFYNSYELYKSGWCRQYIYAANNTAVTYLKPFAKTPHIKTDLFGSAGSAYFAHNVLAVNGDLKTGCSVNWSGSEANPYGVLIVAEGFVEE